MSKLFLSNYTFRSLIFNTALWLFVIYLTFHFISGTRGFLAYLRLAKELKTQKKELETLVDTKISLERRLALLQGKNLDLDLLEELAKRDLGLIKQDEYLLKRSADKGL